MRTRLTAASAALLLVVLAGCGAASGPAPTIERILITTAKAPVNACMDALLTGQLVPDERWGLALQVPGTGERMQPLFPFGYGAARDGDRIALIDDHGKVIAHSGDLIQAGGGMGQGNVAILCAGSIRVVPG